ncbi:hypothetical protein D1AOALGA4SA_11123 [Olavius algarvensis Delta 1 endosymbiont]|nr:hypothetical protein D1AOALGA4SA_11123 [Olavius algarvensis Delta 1 endosymbiont]
MRSFSIADCGIRIADCGMRIADCGMTGMITEIESVESQSRRLWNAE